VRTAALLSVLTGPPDADPRLRANGSVVRLVITRGTPPRVEGCRPASRGCCWNSWPWPWV